MPQVDATDAAALAQSLEETLTAGSGGSSSSSSNGAAAFMPSGTLLTPKVIQGVLYCAQQQGAAAAAAAGATASAADASALLYGWVLLFSCVFRLSLTPPALCVSVSFSLCMSVYVCVCLCLCLCLCACACSVPVDPSAAARTFARLSSLLFVKMVRLLVTTADDTSDDDLLVALVNANFRYDHMAALPGATWARLSLIDDVVAVVHAFLGMSSPVARHWTRFVFLLRDRAMAAPADPHAGAAAVVSALLGLLKPLRVRTSAPGSPDEQVHRLVNRVVLTAAAEVVQCASAAEFPPFRHAVADAVGGLLPTLGKFLSDVATASAAVEVGTPAAAAASPTAGDATTMEPSGGGAAAATPVNPIDDKCVALRCVALRCVALCYLWLCLFILWHPRPPGLSDFTFPRVDDVCFVVLF